MKVINSIQNSYQKFCISSVVKSSLSLQRHSNLLLFALGIILLNTAGADLAHAGQGSYAQACNGILSLVEGTFGALITAAAGIAAIVAAAVGGFKMAWSLLVVAVGSFILRAFILLFNGSCVGQ